MKFLGLFVICFILIVIAIALFGSILSGWALIAVPAFLMALVLRMYLSVDERLEEVERRLGIITEEKEEKTFSEQILDQMSEHSEKES